MRNSIYVIGLDHEKNEYVLQPVYLEHNHFDESVIVYVKLPFAPDHVIWDELRSEDK